MEIGKIIQELIPASEVTFHEDGTVTFRKSFSDRNGFDSKKFTEKILAKINSVPELKGKFLPIQNYDDCNSWPKNSYFVAKFQMRNL